MCGKHRSLDFFTDLERLMAVSGVKKLKVNVKSTPAIEAQIAKARRSPIVEPPAKKQRLEHVVEENEAVKDQIEEPPAIEIPTTAEVVDMSAIIEEMQCETVDSSTHEAVDESVPTVIPNVVSGASPLNKNERVLRKRASGIKMHVARKIRRVAHASKR